MCARHTRCTRRRPNKTPRAHGHAQGTVDELRPPKPVDVPLWLGLFYKKRDKCRLLPPEWLEPGAAPLQHETRLAPSAPAVPAARADALERVLHEEQTNPNAFADLPFHYVEISKELLECAEDDLPNAHRIRSLLKDIEDVRRHKVERGLRNFDHNTTSVKLENLSAMKLNRIRTVATTALDAQPLDAEPDEQPTQRPSQSQSQPPAGNAQLQEALRRRAERR